MKTRLSLIAWLFFLLCVKGEFRYSHWEGVLVVFSALALVPMCLILLELPQNYWYLLPATGLCSAYLLFPHKIALVAALPYLLLSIWITIQEAINLLVFNKFQLLQWVRLSALAYWATGAVWAFCFIASIQPIGFDSVIVGLTAAHFHVAGFVLTTTVYCLLSNSPSTTNRVLGWATLAGMPLVATGITLTKLGFSNVFEYISSLGFVLFALAVLWQHVRLFFQKSLPLPARLAWLGGSVCFLFGVALAALYAVRFSFPISSINIPNMKIWHGTLNAVGFGWLTLNGWLMQKR